MNHVEKPRVVPRFVRIVARRTSTYKRGTKDEEVKGIVTVKYLLLAHGRFTLRKLREISQQNHCVRYNPIS